MADTHVFGLASWIGVARVMTRAHRHDDIEVNVVLTGSLRYLFGGRRVAVDAGAIAVFWAALPHQLVHAASGTRACWLTIPLETVLGWRLPESTTAELLTGVPLRVDRPVVSAVEERFAQWAEDLREESGRRPIALLEMQALLRRITRVAGVHHPPSPSDLSDVSRARATTMAIFIATHFRAAVSAADVAAAVHLHPNYAMKVFRESIGTTIGTYLAQCRIAEAQRLLITTSLTVADVAAAAGFGSTGRMYVAWSEAALPTPAVYRRTNRAAAGWASDASSVLGEPMRAVTSGEV